MKRVCFSLTLFLAASALRLKAQELEFTQVPADGTRLVIVTDPVKNPLLRFDLTNTTNIDQTYSLTHSGFLNVNNLSPGTSLANGAHVISARVPMESVSPGLHSVSMTATPVGGTPDTVSFDVFRVVNRPITGTVDLDLGRVVRSSANCIYSLGTLQLNSGSYLDAEATRPTTRSNTFDFNSTSVAWNETSNFGTTYKTAPTSAPGQGLRLFRSGSPVEFTDANQTVDYNIGFTSTGVKSVLLSGNDFHALFRPEILANSAVNTEGVSLEISATALNNRRFSVVTSGPAPVGPNNGISTSMGRVMLNAASTHAISGTQGLVLHSVGADTDATRVQLSAGSVVNDGVTVTASTAHLFNATGLTTLTSDYSLTFDGTITGRQTRNVSLADLLSSAEDAPLDHEEILAPTIGYHLDVVQKRQFSANGYTAKALVNNTISSIGGQVYSGGSDETTTRASIGSFQFTGPATYYDSFNIAGVSSPTAGGPTVIGTRSLSVTPEGLLGEGSYANVTYDYSAQFYDPTSVSFSANPGGNSVSTAVALADQNQIDFSFASGTYTAQGRYEFERHSGANLLNLSMASGFGNGSLLIDVIQPGIGGTYTSVIKGTFSNDLNLIGAASGDLGEYFWSVTTVVAKSSFGQIGFSVGDKLENIGVEGSSSIFSTPTLVNILDSTPLSSDRVLQMSIDAVSGALGTGSETLASDIARVSGISGELFVLEVNYDPEFAISQFGSELGASVVWYDTEALAWVNAVMGNSDAGAGAARHALSYADYLTTAGGTPQLSHYGIDIVNKKVWAVLDHNSDFAASAITIIPEPASIVMMLTFLGVSAALLRKGKKSRKRN